MTDQALHPAAAPGPRLVSVNGKTYPLESARLTARAEAGIAATTLSQRFQNPHDEPLEVIYTLPLPADGAVLAYSMRMGDRLIKGEIQPREKASKAYLEALYEGRTVGLLELDRADTFQQRLGNLPPRTPVEVEIEVLQPLRFLAAIEGRAPRWEYRFPTVAGVRYEGATGRVPDADRLDVGRGGRGEIPTRVELEIEIAGPGTLDLRPESPSHDIVPEATPSGSRVRLAHGARLDRDVVLSWNACSPHVGVQATEGRGLAGDEGRYAVVTVVPPEIPIGTFHRDLTVLIDASGLMSSLPEGSRVHAVGIGAAPNRALLCGVAGAGRGLELYAADDDTAAEAARRLIGGTSRPVITGLTIAGSAVLGRAPQRVAARSRSAGRCQRRTTRGRGRRRCPRVPRVCARSRRFRSARSTVARGSRTLNSPGRQGIGPKGSTPRSRPVACGTGS